MKHSEREHLKKNEVAAALEHLTGVDSGAALRWVAIVAVVAVVGGGIYAWLNASRAKADGLLAAALRVEAAQVVPPPAPGQPAAPAGSFPTEDARHEAAVAKFKAVADAYPSSAAGITARFKLGSLLAERGKTAEALSAFQAVAAQGTSSIYGRMAALAVADLQLAAGQHEAAIATFREFSTRTDADLPADGILMQLGRAYRAAGKKAEALQTFTRVTDEFPQSIYLGEARREVDALKASM